MAQLKQVNTFTASGLSVAVTTGVPGVGVFASLPAVDGGNQAMTVTKTGGLSVQINFGASGPVRFDDGLTPGALLVEMDGTILIDGLLASVAANAASVSISTATPSSCTVKFQRGSTAASQTF